MATGPVDFDSLPQNVKLVNTPTSNQDDIGRKRAEAQKQYGEWVRQFEERLPLGVSKDPYLSTSNPTL